MLYDNKNGNQEQGSSVDLNSRKQKAISSIIQSRNTGRAEGIQTQTPQPILPRLKLGTPAELKYKPEDVLSK
eukprot:CAMPEP_0168328460 /NCGR_PEP_ID=MMETSP0213-20121227/6506_1 /TAXON_ID=151035 /ORGANISM="Euplotes harpa, Strain FSP1.4" /LENGTH=71 /DNA_ID=CAMNT_0008331559 /DNA_START=548 /DNA_END=763 /DNA_ORIENTATION=-